MKKINKDIHGSGGGKGGGDKAKPPVEAENTLRSRAIARFIDLLGEGEIEGLVNGYNSVFFDQVPIEDAYGNQQIDGITRYHLMPGAPDHTPLTDIPGFTDFPTAESETIVNLPVTVLNGAVSKIISNTAVDDVSLTFSIAALYQIDLSNGNTNPSTVSWSVSIQGTGAPAATIVKTFIKTGKCVSAYQTEYTIRNISSFPGTYPFTIRASRLTADSASNTLQNTISWYSYTQITNRVMVYPDSALFAAEIDASKFGTRIPERAYECHWLITQIPSNYYPYSYKTGADGGGKGGGYYDGIWDGSFKPGWHSNPAWVYYYLLTNKRTALGLDPQYVDKWSLYVIGQYCDELVADGYGGYEPRFTFNGKLENREDAINVLAKVASAFRAMPYWAGGTASASQDSPKEATKNVTAANVIDGQFTYTGTSIKDRHTVVNVSWNDPDEFYKLQVESVDDGDGIARYGYKALDIAAVGCTSRGQAYRYGKWALETEQNQTEALSYKASADHADVLPGDIVNVLDPHYADVRNGGRTVSATGNTITLDSAVVLEIGSTYEISVTLPDGTVEEKEVTTTPDGNGHTVLSISGSFTEVPLTNSVWILIASNLIPRQFMITNIKESEKNMFEIMAVYYDPTKYARVEDGKQFEDPPISKVPSANDPITAPTALNAEEYSYDAGESREFGILFSWTHTRDPRFFQYTVQYRRSDQSYGMNDEFVTSDTFVDIRDVTAGTYNMRIRSTGLGRESLWVELTEFTVYADPAAPSNITGLEVTNGPNDTTFNGPDCEIKWDELLLQIDVDTTDVNINTLTKLKDYQIEVLKYDDTHLRYEFTTDETFIYTLGMNKLDNGTPIRDIKFELSARDIYGKLSVTPTVLLATNPAPTMAGLNATLTPIFNGLKIDWSSITPADNDLAKFKVYSDTGSPPLIEIAEVSKDTTYWVEPGLDPTFTYYVQIEPYDDFGVGIKSDIDTEQPIKIQSEDIGFELVSRLTLLDSLGNGNTQLAHLYDNDYQDDGGITYNSGDWIQYTFPVTQLQDRVHFWCDRASINCYIGITNDDGATWSYLKADSDHTLDVDGRLTFAASEADAATNYWSAAAGAGQINTALYPNGLTGITVRLIILSNTVGMYELRFVDQVIAEQITTNNLAAISANLGTITAGILQSTDLDADEGVLIDLDNESIKFGGTVNPALEWDGSKVELNIGIGGSINVAETGTLTIGDSGQLLMGDNSYLRVGNNIEITSDGEATGQILVSEDTVVDPITNRLNLSGVDYVIIDQGNVTTYFWDGVDHLPYKSLTRIETGEASNNDWVFIEGVFKTRPQVFISPKIMPTYDKRYPDQSQSFRFDVTDLQQETPKKWKFKARASLELTDGFVGTTVGTQTPGTTSTTTPVVTLPPLTKKLTVNANCNGFWGKEKLLSSGGVTTKDVYIPPEYYYVTYIYSIKATFYMYYYVTGQGWLQKSYTYDVGQKGNAVSGVQFTFTTETYASNPITQFYCYLIYHSVYPDYGSRPLGRFGGYRQNITVVSYTTDLAAASVLIPGSLKWMALE